MWVEMRLCIIGDILKIGILVILANKTHQWFTLMSDNSLHVITESTGTDILR
jgi:hypothetical protein